MRESVSFARIGTGWGVRVATKGRHPSPGDEIVVRKANGESKRVTLGGVAGRDPGAFPGPAVYYLIDRGRRPGDGERQRREAERLALIEAGRLASDAILELRERVADGEYYDGEDEPRDRDRERLARMEAALNEMRRIYRERFLIASAA